MKYTLLLILTITVLNCEKAPEAPKAKVQEPVAPAQQAATGNKITLDTQKSVIKWIGTKLKGRHNGTIKIKEGSVIINQKKVVGGEFIIDMDTIEVSDLTGKDKAKLEGHLRSEDFFEIAKFPTSKFVVTSVSEPNQTGEVQVTGNLEMKGITKSITFPAKIQFSEDGKVVTAKANFNINRQLWGITYKGMADNAINDEVNLELDLIANL